MDDIEDVLHAIGRLAKGKASANIRLVPFDRAAVIDEYQAAISNHLRLDGAVGKGGIFVHLATGVSGKTGERVGLTYPLADLGVGDAGAGGEDRLPGRLVDG